MKYLIILTIALCTASCQFEKKAEDEKLVHNTIDLKGEMIGNGGFLLACKNSLMGFEESRSLPAFYYLNNNDEDFIISRFVDKGQGPDEVLHPMNLQYINEDTIGVFDIMNMSYYYVPIKNNSNSVNLSKRIYFDNRFYRVIKTAFNQYLGLSGESHLFILSDPEGKPIQTFFEYPYKDKDEMKIDNSIRSLAYQGSLMANPSSTKCIYAPYNGDIIHFYDIKKDNISLIKKIENIYPDYVIDKGDAPTKKTTNRGYISIATTNSYVYAIYCGKTLEELLKNGETMEGQILRKFDWDGNMESEINLDVPCKFIAVSHDDKTLWAIVINPDLQLIKFNLNKQEGEKESEPITQQAKNNNVSKTQLPDEDYDIKPNDSKDVNKPSSELVRIDLKNIYKSQTDSFFLVIENPNLKITSVEKTSNDINVDVKNDENRSIIYYFIKKDKIGEFSDTVTLNFNNNESHSLNIYGNVIL